MQQLSLIDNDEVDRGPWIQTYTRQHFHLLDPHPDEIDIRDIAHALARICRFNGHVKHFYSVAEHSVYVAQLCSHKNALAGLLHDASEAYIGDVVSPLKSVLPEYKRIEEKLMYALADKFKFEYPLPAEVHEKDLVQLHTEARNLMKEKPDWVPPHVPGTPYGVRPYKLEPDRAEQLFLSWYFIYSRRT